MESKLDTPTVIDHAVLEVAPPVVNETSAATPPPAPPVVEVYRHINAFMTLTDGKISQIEAFVSIAAAKKANRSAKFPTWPDQKKVPPRTADCKYIRIPE